MVLAILLIILHLPVKIILHNSVSLKKLIVNIFFFNMKFFNITS